MFLFLHYKSIEPKILKLKISRHKVKDRDNLKELIRLNQLFINLTK